MKKVLFLVCLIAASLSFNVSAGEKAKFGAERHAEHGVDCAQCHGEKNEVTTPDINQCSKCHDPAQLAEKTKDVKPQNPHVSPHYGNMLECTLCHLQHEAPENYCAQCHSYNFKLK